MKYAMKAALFGHPVGNPHGAGYDHSSEGAAFTHQMAEKWTAGMENEDGTKGPHWTLEQARQVMMQRDIDADPYEFWAVLNMVYSDYVKVAKKFGVGDKIDFYVDMANAFLNDRDAAPHKVAKYYAFVVSGHKQDGSSRY